MLIAISESRRPRRNSVRYPVNAVEPNRGPGAISANGATASAQPIALFDPLKCEAIYQFLISGNLHAFEKITGERKPCLVGGSSYD